MVGQPGAGDGVELVVAELLAQLVPHQRGRPVDVGAPEVPRVVGAGRAVLVTQLLVGGAGAAQALAQRPDAVLVLVDPLQQHRHALVEPHVAPVRRRDLVAVPLVHHLVGDHLRRQDVVVGAEGDHRLGLHRALRVGDDEAEGVKGVVAEPVLDPVDGRCGRLDGVERPVHAPRRPVVHPQAAVGGVAAPLVVADRERGEVRRRRLVELPRRGRAVVVRRQLGELAGGDAGPPRRGMDGDVVEGLVGRLVVDGVPRVRAEGLLHRPHLAGAGDGETGLGEVAARGRRGSGLGRAVVVDRQLVALVLLDRRSQHHVLATAYDAHRLAVERRPADREGCAEVELEARRGAGRAERDDRPAGQALRPRLPPQVEVVVQGVHAGVADVGVDAVLARGRHGEIEVGLHPLTHDRRGGGGGRRPILGGVAPRRCRLGRHPLRLVGRDGAVRAPRAAGQDGEGQTRGQHRAQAVRRHRSPRSSGRASLRPWWICALTVPSGASTNIAISS